MWQFFHIYSAFCGPIMWQSFVLHCNAFFHASNATDFGVRFLMRDQCVISFGLTQMTVVDGESPLGVLATPLGRILLPSLTTPMGSVLWLELTNLSWKVTIGVRYVNPNLNGWCCLEWVSIGVSSETAITYFIYLKSCRKKMWWQYSVPLTIVIGVEIWLQYLR